MTRARDRLSVFRVAWIFLKIGTFAFGGLGATLALIERELVEREARTTKEEITEALTYTKLLPGSTVVQVVAYLGWRLRRWPGSAVATAAFIFPSAVLMALLGYGYSHIAQVPAVIAIRRGVLATVVALLLLTMYRLAKPILRTPLTIGLALAAFVLVAFLHAGAVPVVIGAGALGIVFMRQGADGTR